MSSDERWTVVQTEEHRERSVRERLKKAGWRIYVPSCFELRKDHRKHRAKRRVLVPLFPEYVFVRLNVLRDQWGAIARTIGVAGVLLAGEIPARVPDEVIDKLAARWRDRYDDEDAERADDAENATVAVHKPKRGDKVQVISGPFRWHEAVVEDLGKFDTHHRIGLLLGLFGGTAPVEVDVDNVAPI
jgi:transcriptional antiterminator RfaH